MPPQNGHTQQDFIETRLLSIAQHILVVVFGLLPVFFLPSAVAPFGYSKTLFASCGLIFALLFYGFATLRSGEIHFRFSWTSLILWVLVLIAFASSLLSGNFHDSLIGQGFEVHTTLFITLLALTASAWMLLGTNKTATMRLFAFFAGSTLFLALFHVLRLVFGPDFLSLSLFKGNATLSPFGAWNDLAIFFGLAIILSLVAVEQLRLTKIGKILFGLVIAAALLMLAVINFFSIWLILGVVSMVLLTYGLTKGRLGSNEPMEMSSTNGSLLSLLVSLSVLIVSVVFVVGGSFVGNAVSGLTHISYTEVRPSLSATTGIVKHVYSSDLLFGVGPNRFGDAWRTFKDPAINESIFWNTDFVAGFGYIPTFFATMGLLGGLAWCAFLVFFVMLGLRTLLSAGAGDRVWYFIATTSFVGGLYIWGMSVIYVPGPVLLLLAALCTGLLSAASGTILQKNVHVISSRKNRRLGFMFVFAFLVLIIGSISALYFVGRNYAGAYLFNASNVLISEGAALDTIEAKTVQAYLYSNDPMYVRRMAEYQVVRMRELLSVTQPTEEQKQIFSKALSGAITAAQTAVSSDSTDPQNFGILGTVYATLVPAKIEGAYDRAKENLTKAQQLDPHNPLRLLMLGQLAFAAGKSDEARGYVDQAIHLKANYSDAMFFTAQMDIAAGNIDAAINSSRAITTIEPDNPVRFFQLGVLLFSKPNYPEAVSALEHAVALDSNYSNARFYLALSYDFLHRVEDARVQLNTILSLNPGNELVLKLLGRLDHNQPLIEQATAQEPISDSAGVKQGDGSVTSKTPPDTKLVSPVNQPPKEAEKPAQ